MHVSWSLYLAPLSSILIGTLPLLFFRRSLKLFGIAAAAYFTAIAAKIAIETAFHGFFSSPGIAAYLAYGILTSIFEAGLAYAFILFFRKAAIEDGRSGLFYGLSLSFWESTVLIGFLTAPFNIIDLIIIPFIPAGLLPADASSIYAINYLPLLLPHIIDRISSLIVHLMFGFAAYEAVKQSRVSRMLPVMSLGMIDSIAAWWDFNKGALSYLDLSIILLAVTVAASFLILAMTGELDNFRHAIRRELLFGGGRKSDGK